MKIENAKTTFFNNKEHYLNFRREWAKSVQEAKITTKNAPSWDHPIKGAHHLLYNALRGVELTRGFTLPTKPGKRNNLYDIGLHQALSMLTNVARRSTERCNVDYINKFLKPFGVTVTIDMLEELHPMLPKYEELVNTFKEAA